MTSRLVTSLAAMSRAVFSSDGKVHLRVTGSYLCVSANGGIYETMEEWIKFQCFTVNFSIQ